MPGIPGLALWYHEAMNPTHTSKQQIDREAIPSLYLHVPFCASICYYCDFARQIYRRETVDAWLKAIQTELESVQPSHSLETIYIGGGTPSSLSEDQLETLLCLLDSYRTETKEYTVELNPETVSEEKLNCLKRHGVNRLSIGIQSGDEALLARMNRKHTKADIHRLVVQINACGFSNISMDLIYGLPNETMKQVEADLNYVLDLKPTHLSLYSLSIEPGSVFGKQGVQPIDEDLEAEMYESIVRRLLQEGYEHYEVSNFARPGKQSIHNRNVWQYKDFIGIGYGAWGKEGNVRYDHAGSLQAYLKNPCYREKVLLSDLERQFETLMMGLRLSEGVFLKQYQEQFGCLPADTFPVSIAKGIRRGYLEEEKDMLRCTGQGMELLNSILVEFMEEAEV